jgi:hypothetical protein
MLWYCCLNRSRLEAVPMCNLRAAMATHDVHGSPDNVVHYQQLAPCRTFQSPFSRADHVDKGGFLGSRRGGVIAPDRAARTPSIGHVSRRYATPRHVCIRSLSARGDTRSFCKLWLRKVRPHPIGISASGENGNQYLDVRRVANWYHS